MYHQLLQVWQLYLNVFANYTQQTDIFCSFTSRSTCEEHPGQYSPNCVFLYFSFSNIFNIEKPYMSYKIDTYSTCILLFSINKLLDTHTKNKNYYLNAECKKNNNI